MALRLPCASASEDRLADTVEPAGRPAYPGGMGEAGRNLLLAFVLCVACDRDQPSTSPDDAQTAAPAEPAPQEEASQDEPPAEPLDTTKRIEGGLSESQVEAVVEKHFTGVRECFDKALVRVDEVNEIGAIVVRFTVGASGGVEEATLEGSEFGDEETETCIVEQVGTWTFPKPRKKSATVRYPFFLRSY